jgi:protein TonB
MYGVQTPRDRIASATASILLCALLGYALILGLGVTLPAGAPEALKLFAVGPKPPPPPPERVVPRPARSHRPEGAASPANLKAKATELVAPIPIVRPIVPPLVIVALKPGVGADATAGAAPVPGPGTGAGGIGTGTGSGGAGDGDGDGGDETPPRLVKSRFSRGDFREAEALVGENNVVGRLGVRYTVGTDGRVSQCRVTRSSGKPALDGITCRLIEKRYRYRPSLDAAGRPVPSTVFHNQDWFEVPDDGRDDDQ